MSCLGESFTLDCFKSLLERAGFLVEKLDDSSVVARFNGAEAVVVYRGGVVQAFSEDERLLRTLKVRVLERAAQSCTAEPEVILFFTDGEQMEYSRDTETMARAFRVIQNFALPAFVLAATLLPTLCIHIGVCDAKVAVAASALFFLGVLTLHPLLFTRGSCLRVPQQCRRVTLVKVRVKEIAEEELLMFAVAKHLLSRRWRTHIGERARELLAELGVQYKSVEVKEVDLAALLGKLREKFRVKARLCVTPTPQRNACTIGLLPPLSTICITVGLLADLSSEELEAVLAHEMAHVKRRDLLRLAALVSLEHVTRVFALTLFQASFTALLVYAVLLVYALTYFMRTSEIKADTLAAEVVPPDNLLSALVKLDYAELARSTNHLRRLKGLVPSSHPPAAQRVDVLLRSLGVRCREA